jgi:cell division protein FtsB
MAVPTFVLKDPLSLLHEEMMEKAAATETRRHAPMLAAMQALASENAALKKEVEALRAELARLKPGARVGADKDEDDFRKLVETMSRSGKSVIPTSPILPPLSAVHAWDDFVITDEGEKISGMEAVERLKNENARGFEWEGAWDEEPTVVDATSD